MSTLREAFDTLVDVAPPERAERLRALGLAPEDERRVLALLEAEQRGASVMDLPLADAVTRLAAEVRLTDRLRGMSVGSFRLIEPIGEGGTAVVFRAERAAGTGTQVVALKMLQAGLFSTNAERRFRREQAILAQLDHPNIARLVEGGVSAAGIPYLAMELVEGEPITHAAAAGRLDLEDRLRLFVRLCRTVDAAHAALVIHCDLKPRNVFVDRRGELKVLDFGIARLLDAEAAGERTFTVTLTPEYAAPEQFRAQLPTVAVDVFALGVLLRELITGLRGRDRPPSQSIGDSVPDGLPPPAVLARRLRGDLDAIVAKATTDDPAQRYRSAEALAADIECHLRGEPVAAQPPAASYRLKKFVVRHRYGVAATAAVVAAILLSLTFAVWQARVARLEAARATSVRDFVLSVFDAATAGLRSDQRAATEQLFVLAATRLGASAQLDAPTRAVLDRSLDAILWSAYQRVEYPPDVVAEAERVRDADTSLPRDRFRALLLLAQNHAGSERATELLAAAIEIGRGLYGPDSDEVLWARRLEASSLRSLWRLDEVRQPNEALIRDLVRVYGEDHPVVVQETLQLDRVRAMNGDYALAVRHLEGLLAKKATWTGLGKDRREHTVLFLLGEIERFRGHYAAADGLFRRSLALLDAFDPEHGPHWANDRSTIAEFDADRGDTAAASEIVAQLATWVATRPQQPPQIAEQVWPALGSLAAAAGTADGALQERLDAALDGYLRQFGADGVWSARMLLAVGEVQRALGDAAGARTTLARARGAAPHGMTFLHARLLAEIDGNVAALDEAAGHGDAALRLRGDVAARLTARFGLAHPIAAAAVVEETALRRRLGRAVDPVLLAQAAATLRREHAPGSPRRVLAETLLAQNATR